jgi:hypothetical protein
VATTCLLWKSSFFGRWNSLNVFVICEISHPMKMDLQLFICYDPFTLIRYVLN